MLLLLFLSLPLSYRKKPLLKLEKGEPISKKKSRSETSFKTAFSLTCIVLFHDPCDVPVLFPTLDGFTLVIIMFPFSEPQKQFSIAVLEIDLQRHQGHSGPFGVLVQLLICFFMKKELATTVWVLVPDIAFLIRGNVDIAKPNFAIFLLVQSHLSS